MFTEADHMALQQAAQLVNEVIDKNRATMTLPVLAFLCEAVHDMQMADKYMGNADCVSVVSSEGNAA